MYRRIMVLVEPGPLSGRAQRLAGDLALAWDAEVTVLGMAQVHGFRFGLQHPSLFPARREIDALKDEVVAAQQRLVARGIRAHWQMAMAREPGKRLAEVAAEGGFDLVVVGEAGRGRLARFALNSAAAQAVRHSTVSVLVVRPEDGTGAGQARP